MKTHSNSIYQPIVLFIGAKLLSTGNRLFIGLFGTLMLPLLILAFIGYILSFIFGTPCDIDGIREPVAGSLLYGNNIITAAVIPSSNAIGLHFYPIWSSSSLDEWLYNGGTYQFIALHFILSISAWMGREWEFSFRLAMRLRICKGSCSYTDSNIGLEISNPNGQGSFSNAIPLVLVVHSISC